MAGELGYVGRELRILVAGIVIAAVRTKRVTHGNVAIDVSEGESDGFRHLLQASDSRSVEVSVEGVATVDNWRFLLDEWYGELFTDVEIEHADGSIETPEDGAFLQSLDHTGEYAGHVAFTASFVLSGLVTLTGGGGNGNGGGGEEFTTVSFDTSGPWQVPEGVTEIDIFAVGGGGGGGDHIDTGIWTWDTIGFSPSGGASGGAVTLVEGVPVTPLESLDVVIGIGGAINSHGSPSEVQRSGSPLASAAGGRCAQPPVDPGYDSDGVLTNGNGAGGSWPPAPFTDPFDPTNESSAPGAGSGAGFGGGAASANSGTTANNASGGGGGAGGVGGNAAQGTPPTPGTGGPGALGPDWTLTFGETGMFGGGGGGWGGGVGAPVIGARGVGGGAPNTGGAANPDSTTGEGYSGVVIIRYATPP